MRAILSLTLFFCWVSLTGQVFLQLELVNDPQTRKYTIGDKITYKTTYLGDLWVTGEIKEILIKDNALVLNNELLSLDQVTHFRIYRRSVLVFTGILQSFGVLWTGYGSVLAILNRPNVTWGEVLGVGLGSYFTGWIFKKLFYKVPIKLGENNRLRIVDTRFSVE